MNTSTRPTLAVPSAATGLLAAATALIAVGISFADDLSTPAFIALICADLLIMLAMGALIGASVATNRTAEAEAEAARLRHDLETLDALEPLGTPETGGRR
ncbi:hypothetical protein ACF1G0_23105 [Streptomyces sp. NPDC013953]|uniref:hypothetical protein n=1 Tax=Streptomyces sp. NPDC013953 TaxID=3364868 RepID=UPI0036FD385B